MLFISKQNSGKGLQEAGTAKTIPNSAVDGQNGEFSIFGRGICNVRSRNWITFDHRTDKITPSAVNSASLMQRWRDGSKVAED